jgi:hypothetical protein
MYTMAFTTRRTSSERVLPPTPAVAITGSTLVLCSSVRSREQCTVLGASNQTGPKAIPEEVKLNVRILAFAFPVFAVRFRALDKQTLERSPRERARLQVLHAPLGKRASSRNARV